MKLRLLIAAMLAATAATAAFAQTPGAGGADASISTGARGPGLPVATSIAQALIAEPGLKNSKITVAPEENAILLTGVTPTLASMAKAVEIATQQAGEGNVRNALVTEEAFVDPVGGSPLGQGEPAQQQGLSAPAQPGTSPTTVPAS